MKLRVLSSLVSVVSLSVFVPACGDDDSGNVNPDTSEDAGDTEEQPNEDDAGGGEATSEPSETTGAATTEEPPAPGVDGGSEEPANTDGGTEPAVTVDGGSDNTTGGEETTEPLPPPPECPDLDDRDLVEVPAQIDEDTVWSCQNAYLLPTEVTVVTDGATLTIEPGVEIWGQSGSALVITRGSKIDANGHPEAPIVFTSSALVGQREPGQWGGVLLLGGAPINDAAGVSNAEGVPSSDGYSEYGGDDEDFDCGNMSYVRIEFGGFELSPDNELNNLGVAGCGSATELHHIQVHFGSDDGIEFWGGAPVVHHIVSSRNSDDSFDWASGFHSTVQFLAIQQDPGDADMAFEADGNEDNFAAEPTSRPTFYNVTAVGGDGLVGDSYGAALRRGTAGKFYNSIFTGFARGAIDVRDYESVVFTDGDEPMLTAENTLFFNNSPDGETHFPVDDTNDCVESEVLQGDVEVCEAEEYFDELAYFSDEDKNNVFDVDPELGDPTNLTEPDFVPASGSPVAEGGATPPSGLANVTYLGAFEPGGTDWTAGWTAYPEN